MAPALLQELWDLECFPHIEHYSIPGRILFKFCWVVIVYHAATQLWFETHLLWLWKTTKCSSIHILRKWIIKWALHSFWLFNQEFNDFRRNSAVQHFLRIVHCVYFHCCWGSNWFVLYYMVVHCEMVHSSHILVLRTFDFIRIDFLCIENFFLFSRKTLPCQKSGFRFVFGVIIYVKDHCIMFFSYT